MSKDTLILTMLCSLSKPFLNITTVIKTKTPFPKFLDARSLLLLEEDDLKITMF